MDDNIPEEIKQRRLSEIIDLQFEHSFENLSKYVNKNCGIDRKGIKKSKGYWQEEMNKILW